MKQVLVLVLGLLVLVGAFFGSRTAPTTPTQTGPMFGGVSLKMEYALTDAEREKGLGGRTMLAENAAMLFAFPRDDYYGFWMKDTLIPLDMFWLDAQGQVVSIVSNVATSTFPRVFYPASPARYVLETNSGFANAHAIATGTPLLLQKFPTVSE